MDLKVTYSDIRDETRIELDGSATAVKRVTFHLGKFGPFTERFEDLATWESDLASRVALLKSKLSSLPT